jgi:F-type H+-transporting ATPase subunit b
VSYQQIALWSQVVAAIVFAAIVVWGFRKFIVPAIAAATAAKNEEIAQNERRRDDAKRQVALAQAEVVEADRDASSIRERIAHDAEREAQTVVAEAKVEAERLIRNANGELARSRVAARDNFRIELIEKALNAARHEAKSRIDAGADAKLVERFIDELEREVRR